MQIKNMERFEKILVISLGGAGDTLLATPMLEELRLAFPDAAIHILTMQARAPDVLRCNPCLDRNIHHEFMREHWWKSLAFCRRLRRERYDLSLTVMPQNRLEYNLVTLLIGARMRLGFDFAIQCGALPGVFLTHRIGENTGIHMADNDLRLISEGLGRKLRLPKHELQLFLTDENRAFAERFLVEQDLRGCTVIGFHPGSGTTKNLELKRWPAPKWAELAGLLLEDEEVRILMFGGPEEQSLRDRIRELSGTGAEKLIDVPAGDLLDAAAVIEKLDVMVCNDALLVHVAVAVKTTVVEIMGPTPPLSTGPYGDGPHRIVRTGIPCSPCYGYSRYGIRCVNAEFMACLQDLSPVSARQVMAGPKTIQKDSDPPQ